jgi:hypothetical protein
MIKDQRSIEIAAPPEAVFAHICAMANKFPTFRLFETRPFFFIRMALVDGFRTAWRTIRDPELITHLGRQKAPPLALGDTMGPFTLTEISPPERYMFTLESFFICCQTGYVLRPTGTGTLLVFDMVAERPTRGERIWWFLFKPMHALMAWKVLRTIEQDVPKAVEEGS